MYAAAKVRQKGDNADERATGIQTLPLTLRGGLQRQILRWQNICRVYFDKL